MADNYHACDDCGLLLENIHDLQRHVKNWCPEKDFTLKRKLPSEETVEEIPLKHQRRVQMTDKNYNDQEADAYKQMLRCARGSFKKDCEEKYEEYIYLRNLLTHTVNSWPQKLNNVKSIHFFDVKQIFNIIHIMCEIFTTIPCVLCKIQLF